MGSNSWVALSDTYNRGLQNTQSPKPVSFEERVNKETRRTSNDVKSIIQSMLSASLQNLLTAEHKHEKEAGNVTIRTTQPCRFAYLDLGSNMGVQIRKL